MIRLYQRLRSRRLAAFLIGAISVYASLMTLIPLGDPRSPAVAEWAARHPELERVVGPLGLHQPFTSPAFLSLAFLLVLATAACAWERTGIALSLWRAADVGAWSDPAGRHPRPTFTVRAEGPDEAARLAQDAFRTLRMRPSSDGLATVGSRRRFASCGSPFFHWALVALFLSVGFGQLVRSEGDLLIVEGGSIVDGRDAYAPGLTTGPLFSGGFTGWQIGVSRIEQDLVIDGIGRGNAPLVSVRSSSSLLEESYVYPNRPIQHGSVVIHGGKTGPAVLLSVTFPNGEQADDQALALANASEGSAPWGTMLITERASGKKTEVRVEAAPDKKVVISIPSIGYRSDEAGPGGRVETPDGTVITFEAPVAYARLTVVNDPSVPFIYLFFAAACLFAAIALLMPTRIVAVVYREDVREIAVWVLRRRIDPAFPSRVRRAFGAWPQFPAEET